MDSSDKKEKSESRPAADQKPDQRPVGAVPENQREAPSTGRYRLMANHVIDGRILEVGTEIGTDTEYPYTQEPSVQMLGLDAEGTRRVRELHKRVYDRDPPWDFDAAREEDARKVAELSAADERRSEPVSHQQAWERGDKEYRGNAISGPPMSVPARTIGGDRQHALGPAPAEKPLQESLPKID